jgi:PAS domain S-box-containing protein
MNQGRNVDSPADGPLNQNRAPLPDNPAREALDWLHRFVSAIESSPAVAVHSHDRDGIVRFWNNSCAELFQVPVAQAIGQPLFDIVSHLGRENEFKALMEQVWRTGKPSDPADWEVLLPDGAHRWVHSSHFPVLRDGVVQQVFCMVIDVTARKSLEDSLQRTAQVFDNCRSAILVTDTSYRVVAVNRAFSDISGFPADEVVGSPLPSLRFGLHDTAFYDQLLARIEHDGHWKARSPACAAPGRNTRPGWR